MKLNSRDKDSDLQILRGDYNNGSNYNIKW